MSTLNIIRYRAVVIFIVTVLTTGAPTSHGQSYFLTLSQHQRNFYSGEVSRETIPNPLPPTAPPTAATTHNNHTDQTNTIRVNPLNAADSEEDNKTAILVIKNIQQQPTELSQTAMDVITIVWYVATFLALAAFFLLMACSDRRCADTERGGGAPTASTPAAPPTPSPSYSEFAPPSYESVLKLQQHEVSDMGEGIFVIPLPREGGDKDLVAPPAVNYYTINEVQKLGS